MSDKPYAPPAGHRFARLKSIPSWVWIFSAAAIIYTVIALNIINAHPVLAKEFSPSIKPLLQAPMRIQIHVAGAISAFMIGAGILLMPKGRGLHKPMGWAWIIAMSVTAVSSFFLFGLNGQRPSVIHILSAWTVIALPMGVAAIRNANVQKHSRRMTGLFLGGMVIAGLFSFLPGRLMWGLLFSY